MASRKAILKIEDQICINIETSFTADEIETAADSIHDELMETEDGWNEQKVVDLLSERGYITVIGPGPEVIDILL